MEFFSFCPSSCSHGTLKIEDPPNSFSNVIFGTDVSLSAHNLIFVSFSTWILFQYLLTPLPEQKNKICKFLQDCHIQNLAPGLNIFLWDCPHEIQFLASNVRVYKCNKINGQQLPFLEQKYKSQVASISLSLGPSGAQRAHS